MNTFLLTWNPSRWPWPDLAKASRLTEEGTPYQEDWSMGNRKSINRGDRVFLLKQGKRPRGFIAAGRITSEEVRKAPHYQPNRAARGDTALLADVEFERILDPDQVAPLSIETLDSGPLQRIVRRIQASGIELPTEAASELEVLWAMHLEGIDGPRYLQADEAGYPEEEGKKEESFLPYQDGDSRAVVFRQIRERRGQQAFRNSLLNRYGAGCMISGCRLIDVVEAAHIKPYRGEADNHPTNGLLLRADLHTLFDLDLIGVEPENMIVRVNRLAKQAGYEQFDGIKLICVKSGPNKKALEARWRSFCRRQQK